MTAQARNTTARPFEVRALSPNIGAELIGVNPADGMDALTFAAIYEAFLQYQVLLFRTGELPPGRQVEFARHFGKVQIHVMNQYHADGYPELYRLTNLDADGKPNGRHPDKGTLAWHTDGSWERITGQATIIFAE
ncbi:MAG TPA: TauD/TfdA family dioxygenase, partial [Burkholderiales bacterium]|nr:TauD/TfdA family dioxygenase [Burkholderiales bacterium]